MNEPDEITPRVITNKDKNFWHHLRKYFREYTEVTGIHGLRYVIEKRSGFEKIIWTIILLISLGGCLYMIYEIFDKYDKSPVVVSFATEDTPLYEIPFPAVTICPESKFSKEKYNHTDIYLKLHEMEQITNEEGTTFDYVNVVCSRFTGVETITYNNRTFDNNFFKAIDDIKIDTNETLFLCGFFNGELECLDVFTPIFIDEGICYSFNIFDRSEIFRNHVYHYKEYYKVSNKSDNFFDPEIGYKDNSGIQTYPRRALKAGSDSAFMAVLMHRQSNNDVACNSFLQGYRVLIHNAWDVPRVSEYYFRVPHGKVVMAAVEPDLIKTSEAVRRFRPEKRKCFMRNERYLRHFQQYSQPNCLLECLTNYTLQKCGCVQFFMPRDESTPICGEGYSDCTMEAEDELKIKDLEKRILGQSFCDCKPTCTNLRYNIETSHSNFYYKDFFLIHPEVKNFPFDEFQWSILQIYFKDEQFTTTERNELYGISDLISNFGGLLGLFTGFSLITLAEIIYFCTLRVFCNERLYGLWSGPTDV